MQSSNFLTELRCILAIDILRKLPFLFPGEMCHPAQVIQYDGVQLVLTDMVGCAFTFAALPVGVTFEIVSKRQGAGVPRPVECDARTLSKERVQKRNSRFPFFPATTAEKGEYLPFGVFPRPSSKRAHRAFVWLTGR